MKGNGAGARGTVPLEGSRGVDASIERLFSAPRQHSTYFWYSAVAVAEARASCRYRIGNLIDHMPGATAVIGAVFPWSERARATTVACIRPIAGVLLARQVRALRARGVRVVADYDDLLFAGPVSGFSPSAGGRRSRLGSRRRVRYARALELFDEFTVATSGLARHLSLARPGARVTTVPNGLSERWVGRGARCRPWQPGDARVIRYFSGSPSHDADFASIAEVLRAFLVRHPDVVLDVRGPLRFDVGTFPTGRVRHAPRLVPFDDLPASLASSWLTIAPLVRSAFNECKSAIKFLEPAAFGCPTIATPNEDLRRHAAKGGPVVLCETKHEWLGALESMLDSRRRMRVGAESQEYVLAHGMAAESAAAWRAMLGSGDEAPADGSPSRGTEQDRIVVVESAS